MKATVTHFLKRLPAMSWDVTKTTMPYTAILAGCFLFMSTLLFPNTYAKLAILCVSGLLWGVALHLVALRAENRVMREILKNADADLTARDRIEGAYKDFG